MENKHRLALFVTYYLSRFDNEALKNLSYSNWNEAYSDIAKKLDIKRLSVRNRRDEFDPLFGYRTGWNKRPMSPSRIKVVQALEDLDEFQIREIVKDILSGTLKKEPEEEEQLLSIVIEGKKKSTKKFILRAPTGKSAEEFFIKRFKRKPLLFKGELIDCRDLGCGYDFKIKSALKEYFIEVKGLSELYGGILFTDKEWKTANEKGDDYFLCIIKNLMNSPDNPDFFLIKNPSQNLTPKRNICTVI